MTAFSRQVLEALREETIDRLVMNYGHGKLSMEAFQRRLDEAYDAKDQATLAELTAEEVHVLHCALHAYSHHLATTDTSTTPVSQRFVATLQEFQSLAEEMGVRLETACEELGGHSAAVPPNP
jgi:uncharacterized Zn finger protein